LAKLSPAALRARVGQTPNHSPRDRAIVEENRAVAARSS
jgi:hypothetical protein